MGRWRISLGFHPCYCDTRCRVRNLCWFCWMAMEGSSISSCTASVLPPIHFRLHLTIGSPYFQVQDCQRGLYNNGHQWLEFRYASLLHPDFLSVGVRILSHESRCYAIADHTCSDSEQHTVWAGSSLGRTVSRVYPFWMGMLGCRTWLDGYTGWGNWDWKTNWIFHPDRSWGREYTATVRGQPCSVNVSIFC